MKRILVTGIAGFIGSWIADALLRRGDTVIGVDNFNDYYDVSLKRNRVNKFVNKCIIHEIDISNYQKLEQVFVEEPIDQVCHLAAQAGVSYSLKNPFAYEISNNMGTLNLLELCRQNKVPSFVYASSSSVYGANKKVPFSVEDNIDKTISLYAATKRYNELIAYTYHHLFGLQCIGLRFFTVYGPWGRPDMALFKFTKAIFEGRSIDLYNHGKMKRDFTYITDVVDGVLSAMEKNYPCEIFNLGNSTPIELNRFVEVIEKELGRKAQKNLLPLQPGDVPETFADIEKSRKMLDYEPKVKIEEGIKKFITWYKEYYKIPGRQ
ncbi:MAG: GDP-mannose 4,6-dehydratase [Elusimicrobia bacterium]|nr:GDP-mannose 4,6-dehydratase [Candidatus Obscuribacterium magneticum]